MEKSNKTAGIVVGLIAIIIIGGGIFWAMNNNEDTTMTNENENQSQTSDQAAKSTGDIVAVASDTPSLSTLVTAVKAASLVETLQGEGPFTVFAPTNDAFAALPDGTLDSLLLPENVEKLKSILTYHVVSGEVMAADLKDGQEITTVQGGKLTVNIADGKVCIVDAKGGKSMVETTDVDAKNGVVHVVGGVLLPS